MKIETGQVIAPEFPRDAEWVNTVPIRIDECLISGPVLLEFWDFARINSLRTLPYMEQWHSRYAEHGVTVIGVHSPGFSVSADDDAVRAAIERLGVERPVLLDSHFQHWHDYGNKGWPARYLWGPKGQLRYWHYGEGDYRDCELALQETLREYDVTGDLPEPLPPLRPEDAPGAAMLPQTADIALPSDTERVELQGNWREGPDWLEADDVAAALSANCDAGSAWAVLSGRGVDYPGCHQLAISGGGVTVVAGEAGLRVHGLQFTPVAP